MSWRAWTASAALLSALVSCVALVAGAAAQTVVPAKPPSASAPQITAPGGCDEAMAGRDSNEGRQCRAFLLQQCAERAPGPSREWCDRNPPPSLTSPPPVDEDCDLEEAQKDPSPDRYPCRAYWYAKVCEGKRPTGSDQRWCDQSRSETYWRDCRNVSGALSFALTRDPFWRSNSNWVDVWHYQRTWCANETKQREARGQSTNSETARDLDGPDYAFELATCDPTFAAQDSPEGRACKRRLETVCFATGGANLPDSLKQWCAASPVRALPPPPAGCNRNVAEEESRGKDNGAGALGGHCRDYWYIARCSVGVPTAADGPFCDDARAKRFEADCVPILKPGGPGGAPGGYLSGWCNSERERRREAGLPTLPTDNKLDNEQNADVFYSLGVRSPLCKLEDISEEARRNCKASGSIQHPYPLTNYGLDNQVEVSFDDPGALFPSILHWILRLIWYVYLYTYKGTMLLVEWAYSLDLLGRALSKVRVAALNLHENVLGKPWLLFGLVACGAWAMWNGLVRQRIADTAAGVGVTLVLMIGALWIIYDPVSTIGQTSKIVNRAGISMLSIATQGDAKYPAKALSDMQIKTWEQNVTRKFYALQFVDEEFGKKVGGWWLANPPNGAYRRGLWKLMKGEQPEIPTSEDEAKNNAIKDYFAKMPRDTNPSGAEIQDKGGILQRWALLVLTLISGAGAIALWWWIARQLVVSSLMLLMYLLLTPVLAVFAGFGFAGRTLVIERGKEGAFYAIAFFVVSAIAGGVGLLTAIVISLDLGWFGTEAVLAGATWGIYGQRGKLVNPLRPQAGGGFGLAKLFFGYRMLRDVGSDVWRTATFLPRLGVAAGAAVGGRATRAGVDALRRRRHERQEGTDAAIREQAGQELDGDARRAILMRRQADVDRARAIERRGAGLRQRRNEVDRELSQLSASRLTGSPRWRALTDQKAQLSDQLARHQGSAASKWANSTLSRYTNPDGSVTDVSAADVRAWRDERQTALASGTLNWDDADNLRAAGIDPGDLARARRSGTLAQVNAYRQQAGAAMSRHQELFDRQDAPVLSDHTRRTADREYGHPGYPSHSATMFRDSVQRQSRRARDEVNWERRRRRVNRP